MFSPVFTVFHGAAEKSTGVIRYLMLQWASTRQRVRALKNRGFPALTENGKEDTYE